MLPYSMIAGGTFKATASTPFDISLVSQNPPDYFVMRNITQWGSAVAKDVEFWWQQAMAQGTANGIHQASGSAGSQTLNSFQLASDGVSTYDTSNPPTFTANTTVTAVTKGSSSTVTVVTLTNDGTNGPKIAVGDTVRLYNIAGMQQISGMLFQVLVVTSTTSITIDLDSQGFAASGTTGVVQKVIPNRMYPRYGIISTISQANPCVVELTRDSDFTVGEEVSFRIPASTASPAFTTMSQLNNMKGVVTVVTKATATTSSSITVNIDTSGFSAFALPTSAQAAVGVGQQPISMVVPAGSGVVPNQSPPGTNLLDTFTDRNTRIIHLGATMFANSSTNDVWEWQAFKYDQLNGM